MEKKNLELTQDEIKGLIQLLDFATKAGGLNAAENALYFAKKLHKMLDVEKEK